MKKYCHLLFFICFITSICCAQENNSFDITTPFKLWLLNNEAKAMSEIGCDTLALKKNSSPLSILPKDSFFPKRAEEELWRLHRKIYSFLNEVQNIYDLAKLYGNNKFSVLVKKARPEIWSYSPFTIIGCVIPKTVLLETRKDFLNSLLNTIGIDVNRDKDLSYRLKNEIFNFKDEEYRLIKEYISMFKALYPTDKSIIKLENFLTQGPQKKFGIGVTEIIKSARVIDASNKDEDGNDSELLNELEVLTETSTSEENKPTMKMEAPDPEAVDIYDIW